jgi:serine/threonine-protein kinase
MSPRRSIAHYRIIAKLGDGGMGEIWRATDTRLNRDVAIKILPEVFSQGPDRMACFTREAQLLAQLNHPNIAAIYGVEERALVMPVYNAPYLVYAFTVKSSGSLFICLRWKAAVPRE